MLVISADQAIERARELTAAASGRVVVGITGSPGVGKSTLAERVVAAVEGAVLVGMDGFHLAHTVLAERGWVERKGAPHTFDAAGYVALLRRLRSEAGTVWAPQFRREIEDAVAGAVAVPPDAPLVVTEGNYLLLGDEPWSQVPGLVDETWFLRAAEPVRVARLAARHVQFGRAPQQAWERAASGSDAANAALVEETWRRADVVVDVG